MLSLKSACHNLNLHWNTDEKADFGLFVYKVFIANIAEDLQSIIKKNSSEFYQHFK